MQNQNNVARLLSAFDAAGFHCNHLNHEVGGGHNYSVTRKEGVADVTEEELQAVMQAAGWKAQEGAFPLAEDGDTDYYMEAPHNGDDDSQAIYYASDLELFVIEYGNW